MATTLEIDHIAKAAQTVSALGSQHKKAGIDGASYLFVPDIRGGEGEISTSKILVVKDREGRVRPACERRPNGDSLAGYLHIDSRFGEMRAEIVAPDDEDAVILAGDVAESERFIRSRKRTTQGDIQKHLGRRTDYAAAVVAELTRLGIAARKSERGPIEIIN